MNERITTSRLSSLLFFDRTSASVGGYFFFGEKRMPLNTDCLFVYIRSTKYGRLLSTQRSSVNTNCGLTLLIRNMDTRKPQSRERRVDCCYMNN